MQPINVDLPATCFTLAEALSRVEVQDIIDLATDVGFTPTAGLYPASYRDNDRLVLEDADLAAKLFERLRPHLPRQLGSWTISGINPRFRLCRYRDGQAFRIHRDGVHHGDDGSESKLTFMVYLNDAGEFTGGRTRFFRDRDPTEPLLEIAPRAGTLIVFDHALWHDGEPVTDGVKYVLRSDILYKPAAVRSGNQHRGYIWRIRTHPDGGLVSGGRDRTVRFWSREGPLRRVGRGHKASVLALAVSPEGVVYSGSRDGSIREWRRGLSVDAHRGAVLTAAWSDGLISGGADGCVRLWSPSLGLLDTWQHGAWVWAVTAGRLSAGEDGRIRSWPDGAVRFESAVPITALCDLPRGFASGDARGRVRVHRGGKVEIVADHGARVREIIAVPGGIATAGEDDTARVIDLPSGVEAARHVCADFATSLALHADGSLAVASYDGTLSRLSVCHS